jgi:hypothetical protein
MAPSRTPVDPECGFWEKMLDIEINRNGFTRFSQIEYRPKTHAAHLKNAFPEDRSSKKRYKPRNRGEGACQWRASGVIFHRKYHWSRYAA